jgi:hypothetical protein
MFMIKLNLFCLDFEKQFCINKLISILIDL